MGILSSFDLFLLQARVSLNRRIYWGSFSHSGRKKCCPPFTKQGWVEHLYRWLVWWYPPPLKGSMPPPHVPPHSRKNLHPFRSCINSSRPQGGCWVTGSLHSLAGESFNAGSKGAQFPVVPMNMHAVCAQQFTSSN